MKAIMYHYVRKSRKELPYFRYLNIENFKKQLDFFDKVFGFVRFEEFLEFSQNPKKYFKKLKGKILLTFDDGFSDHYEFVLPELIKRRLFGFFFIPTGVYKSKKALSVHRIHYLLGVAGGGAFNVYCK